MVMTGLGSQGILPRAELLCLWMRFGARWEACQLVVDAPAACRANRWSARSPVSLLSPQVA